MMAYHELSVTMQVMYGICAVGLMIMVISVLVTVCSLRLGRWYRIFSFTLAAAAFLIMQGISEVRLWGVEYSLLSGIIGKLPCVVLGLFLLWIAILEGIFFFILWRKKNNMLEQGAIKESLDALPDGVCFFDVDGHLLLVNTQMQRISGELFQTEILNAWSFWLHLENIGKKICNAHTVVAHTKDGKIWEFHRNGLKVGDTPVQELLAYDVTRQYQLSKELEERNKRLGRLNERLREYSREVERVTAENEILAAKIQVHDNVGRSLLAFRSYLMQPEKERDKEGLLFLWRYTISVLRNETKPVIHNHDWELLLEAAQAVDVKILRKGELPEGKREREIVMTALHECLTNTVKHAGGNKLYCFIQSTHTKMKIEVWYSTCRSD